MLKFFRKIRYKLMSENKISRYFKYAIGEIILVVIGILIALQINNWNEGTKEQNKETIYLKNLERDLTNQLDFIDDQISYETDFTNAASYLLSSFNGKNFIKIDTSFFRNLTLLQSRKTFLINDPTYTDMLSSGNIDIIKNKNIKDKLIQYYQELERIEKIIQNNNSLLVDQQYASFFLKIGYYFDEETIGIFNYKQNKSSKLNLKYENELAKISKEILNKNENKLQLMNIINLRHMLSLGSLSLMETSKKNTQLLLEELKNLNKKN